MISSERDSGCGTQSHFFERLGVSYAKLESRSLSGLDRALDLRLTCVVCTLFLQTGLYLLSSPWVIRVRCADPLFRRWWRPTTHTTLCSDTLQCISLVTVESVMRTIETPISFFINALRDFNLDSADDNLISLFVKQFDFNIGS